jgi:hypothetical protein
MGFRITNAAALLGGELEDGAGGVQMAGRAALAGHGLGATLVERQVDHSPSLPSSHCQRQLHGRSHSVNTHGLRGQGALLPPDLLRRFSVFFSCDFMHVLGALHVKRCIFGSAARHTEMCAENCDAFEFKCACVTEWLSDDKMCFVGMGM